jgi:hypothetical protein
MSTEIRIVNQSSPAEAIKLTRGQKLARRTGGLALLTAATAGAFIATNHDTGEGDMLDNIPKETPIIYADHDTKKVKVPSGAGVDEVIQRAYGIDVPEGTSQVVQNNPEYAAQYQAVVDANGGSEELRPGKLDLPVDFYTQEEVDQMQANQ